MAEANIQIVGAQPPQRSVDTEAHMFRRGKAESMAGTARPVAHLAHHIEPVA